jgi:Na+/melibiose symporter-like transporter
MFVLYLVTLIFLRRYRITRARHIEILAGLERRPAKPTLRQEQAGPC